MSWNKALAGAGFYFMFIKKFKCNICEKACQGYLKFEEHMKEHKK